jgi:phenylalanyl-tRNA synthetase beta chain
MNKILDWLKKVWNDELPSQTGAASGPSTTSTDFEKSVADASKFHNIVVAKVTKVEKHPNADRLRIVELTNGISTISPVVCGAWNFEAGAVVPLALPGAVIPHNQHDPEDKPFTLSKAKIRGIESQGMICSGKELGLTTESNGILILKDDAPLGSEFSADLVK